MLSDKSSDWVVPQPVEALEFVLAGTLAEEHFFGHALPGGQDGDLRVWRIGFSATDVFNLSELEVRLGVSIQSTVERMRVSTIENSERIMRVASSLAGVPDIRTLTSLGFSPDWTLTEAQIIRLIN